MGPQDFEYPQFLQQLTFTHQILRSTFFGIPPTPPICLKIPQCGIFALFWSFHFKDTPQSRGPLRKFYFTVGNVTQFFFGGIFVCWDYVISLSCTSCEICSISSTYRSIDQSFQKISLMGTLLCLWYALMSLMR